MSKLSVIIPVYNTADYVEKCMKSVLDQTMQDLEIIVVNDGSTDNSEEVINKFIRENQTYKIPIKYFKKENGGLSDARNYGVKKATGDYIVFFDSDDYIGKDLYKNLEKYMDEKIDLIKFKMQEVNEKGEILTILDGPVFEKCTGEEAYEKLCTQDKYLDVACLYLYRREFFVQNEFEYKKGIYHEDMELTTFVMIQAKSVVSTDNVRILLFEKGK